MMFLFHLASHLHMSVEDVMKMSTVEINAWNEYFKISQEKQKQQAQNASRRR